MKQAQENDKLIQNQSFISQMRQSIEEIINLRPNDCIEYSSLNSSDAMCRLYDSNFSNNCTFHFHHIHSHRHFHRLVERMYCIVPWLGKELSAMLDHWLILHIEVVC